MDNSDKLTAEKEIMKLFKQKKTSEQVITSNRNTSFRLNAFLSSCGDTENSPINPMANIKSMTIKEELALFITLALKTDLNDENGKAFSTFWKSESKRLPLLASLVRKYCIIPASSVPAESAFSEGNYLQRKERSKLSSKNLRYSLTMRSLIKSNLEPNP